ncbi:MAG: hypothetical protein AAFP19_25675 [Bacteroidota bacterium]
MKIRIKDNSLRLRLSQGEVKRFAEEGRISSQIRFSPLPDAYLSYVLNQLPGSQVQVHFGNNIIEVFLPEEQAAHWANSDQVGIDGQVPLGSGEQLSILVEKDFQCLTDRPGEDESDLFPHPNTSASC